MRYLSLSLILILLGMPSALAQDAEPLCEYTLHHKPADDVIYKPDPDVVPADLNAYPDLVPDVIEIPLTINMAERLNQKLPAGMQMESSLGIVQIHKDGTVIINGKDVTAETKAVCSRITVN